MADWVTGKVTKVQNWTDALFSLTVHAPVLPFTAGQFTKLGLEIDGERVQRAYSYVNSPDNPDLEFYLVTVPDGKLSPRLAALKPGDEVQVVSEAAGFFVLDEVPDCETLWKLATDWPLFIDSATRQRFRSLQKSGPGSRRTLCRRLKLFATDARTGKTLRRETAHSDGGQSGNGSGVAHRTDTGIN